MNIYRDQLGRRIESKTGDIQGVPPIVYEYPIPTNQLLHTVTAIRDEDRAELERKAAKLLQANLTLATLCDMVLGEAAPDRSDDALIHAVRKLLNERRLTKKNRRGKLAK